MTQQPARDGTPLRITIEGTVLTGNLTDNATSRSLIDQLPLTLSFTDYGGQEMIADLPTPLSLDGMPAGDDADPLTIGYYAPAQAIVFYYEPVGYFNGIVRIGTLDDLSMIRDLDSGFTATLTLAP